MHNLKLKALRVADSQEVGPEDSVSNVSRYKSTHVKASSQLSRVSAASCTCIKAEAEKAAPVERAAALKKRHLIETQHKQLRKEKETLELEMKMAAAHAKNQVLEANASRNGSRVSDGMQSYFEKASVQPTSNLKLTATAYVPKEEQTDSLPAPLVVRPEERTQEQVSQISAKIIAQTDPTNQLLNSANQMSNSTNKVTNPTRPVANLKNQVVRNSPEVQHPYTALGGACSFSNEHVLKC